MLSSFDLRSLAAAAPVALIAAASALPSPQQFASTPQSRVETVYYDTLDANGNLTGGTFEALVTDRHNLGVIPAPCTLLTQSLLPPNPANRIDLVFVGDGYTASQLATYASQVSTISATFFSKDPYLTYQPFFLLHRVDVVSIDSGVDNDPTQGILKNTAMDMGFWCGGIQRALCVDVGKAYNFANNAPDVDLVAALANSSTYGGAGYPSSNLGTCAAGNGASLEIMRHEFGHALGDLADEYNYGGPTTYTGSEPGEPNISKLTAAQMAGAGTKWASWLNTNNAAYDGLVSTFEGAGYSQFGLFRPTNNSIMRSLDRPFNLPSCEAMIIQIYQIVRPIDDASSTATTYNGTETLFVTPVAPVGHPLDVQWSLNGTPIPGATGTSTSLASLGLGNCPATVSVTVTDNTTLVRNSAARALWMTQSLSFNVLPGGPLTSSYCVTSPNSVGPGALIQSLGTTSIASNNFSLLATGCRPNTTGLFFYGMTQTQVPFGNGVRCVENPFFRLPARQANLFGDILFNVNLNLLPAGGQISAGELWNFQCYYRDLAGGGAGFNASNGLIARFCP